VLAQAAIACPKADALVIARIDHQVGDCVVGGNGQDRLRAVGARLAVAIGDALVEQEDFNVLGAVGE